LRKQIAEVDKPALSGNDEIKITDEMLRAGAIALQVEAGILLNENTELQEIQEMFEVALRAALSHQRTVSTGEW